MMEFEWDLDKARRQGRGEPINKADEITPEQDDLRPEYDLSQLKGPVRGKYLESYRRGTNLALLAPDVRAAFPTDEAVNRALRSVMPGTSASG